MGVDFYNAERYPDPTAFEALRKIEAEERAKRYRPLVFICSPFATDPEANTEKARTYCRFAVDSGAIPVAPHLLYPQFMSEANPEERELGLFFGRVLLGKCAQLWVFGDTVSEGMEKEIRKARFRDMEIRYFTEDCKEVKPL